MKKQVKRTTPARAEVVEMIEVTLCDLCEAEEFARYQCKVCGRDVCGRCSDVCYTEDHSERLCLPCKRLHGKYKYQISATEATQADAEDTIRAAWKAESLGKE